MASIGEAEKLDVMMRGMSGLELQDLLRRRAIDQPVVFIIGAADLAMAVTAMRNYAADFIEKPFEGASLIERVRQAVARHADRVDIATLGRRAGSGPFRPFAPRECESSICSRPHGTGSELSHSGRYGDAGLLA